MRPPIGFDQFQAHARAGARRAAVIGASMAGLLAARVLAEHYDEVWLLDRDSLPDADQHRRATPHSRHAHGLLARGREAIESLLPGITNEWVANGAHLGDLHDDVAFHGGLHAFRRAPSGLRAVAGSRPLLEGAVRRRVLDLPEVRACTGVDVQGLRVDVRGRVNGVQLASLIGDEAGFGFDAELVVDATGRASRLPAWLRAIGREAPQEERIEVDLRYATCHFRRDPAVDPGCVVALCAATPDSPLPGVMLAQEGDRWVVTLGGYGDDAPPLDLAGFIERAQRMPSPELSALVRHAVPIGEPIGYRFAHSQRRRYERLAGFPEGLLAFGDAICSFNPIYGQGLSVAAAEALALRDLLRARERRLAPAFFARAARIVDTPWHTAAGADLALDAVPGPRPLAVRVINAYVAQVFSAAAGDAKVAAAFLRVAHLLAEPSSLMTPSMLWRVMRANRARGPERSMPAERAFALGAKG
jgi:2-polyprenyl-6-methoxyphenol hydroxylase-like FAD-dependent oxidoreductase